MKFRIFLGILTLLLVTSLDTFAQDGRHSFSFSLLAAPDNLSFHYVYRSDDDNYKYNEDAMSGYGIGYAFNIIPFISAEAKYELVKYRGTEQEERINIDDRHFLVGLKLHPIREPFKVELNLDYLFSKSTLNSVDQNSKGEGRGAEFGLAGGLNLLKNSSIMFETSARIVLDGGYEGSSGDIRSFDGVSTIFKLTYEIEF